MITFKSFVYLSEGGNVKVGDATASPIHVTPKNRESVQNDTHEFLHHVAHSFHQAHGGHLFGKNHKALHTGSAFSGSTKHLMDKNINHKEFVQHKKKAKDSEHAEVGDIDVKIPHEHAENLGKHMSPGKRFGKYTVVGVKRSGGEHHALVKHDNGQTHQVDFEGSHYHKDEPTHFDKFAHSSDWHDTKSGIKGVHHKQLINAVGTTHHKFSIMHGLGSRENPKEPKWEKDTHKITKTLFGDKAQEKHLHSFHGVAHLIKHHIPASEHQKIYDKYKADTEKTNKHIDNSSSLHHLRTTLGIKD